MGAVAVSTAQIYLPPLKAIRKHCLSCCCDQAAEVRLCPVNDCELYPYRFGKGPDVKPELTPLRSIRANCVECSGSGKAASVCGIEACVLLPYCDGHNPQLKGRRVQAGIDALRTYHETHIEL